MEKKKSDEEENDVAGSVLTIEGVDFYIQQPYIFLCLLYPIECILFELIWFRKVILLFFFFAANQLCTKTIISITYRRQPYVQRKWGSNEMTNKMHWGYLGN